MPDFAFDALQVIVSSPLTLSHNVNDPTISEAIWPIITNVEALEVSKVRHFPAQFPPF